MQVLCMPAETGSSNFSPRAHFTMIDNIVTFLSVRLSQTIPSSGYFRPLPFVQDISQMSPTTRVQLSP